MDNVVQHIKIEDIVPRDHHYNLIDIKSLEDLAISIKENGIKEPLRLKKTNDKYEIITGNKRYRAAILAGLSKVPAIIEDYDYNNLLKYITGNDDNSYPKSINNDSDVVNLSELSKEYERDDFNMNNEQMNNNVAQQPTPAAGTVPTFGGRFFPSLEDEPTNMAFNTTIEPTQAPVPPANNYIDLTDTNTAGPAPMMPEQNVNTMQAPQEVQQNIMQQPVVDNGIMPPNNGSVLNIESLTQNNSMAQPVQEVQQSIAPQPMTEPIPTNIDNNFQEVMSDFQPNPAPNMNIETPVQPIIEQQPIVMEQAVSPMNNTDPMMNNQINIPQDIVPTPVEPVITNPSPENIGIGQPEPVMPQPINNIPSMDNTFAQPVMEQPMQEQQEIVSPQPEIVVQQLEIVNQVPQKDINPVINTLKAVSVNLENFGYTIRITDEDLPTSYKITIEIDK